MNRMKPLVIAFLLLAGSGVQAQQQDIDKIINPTTVGEVEKTLSSDDMRGRATFTPDIERAADYIEQQFRAAGLKTWNGSKSYRQPFSMIRSTLVKASATLDGKPLPEKNIGVMSSQTHLKVNEKSRYEIDSIVAGANAVTEAMRFIRGKKNCIVWVDTSFARNFGRMTGFGRQQFKSDRNVIFLLSSERPRHFSIEVEQTVTESKLANVVGILPGTGKKDEYVIFSGHYDHLGVKTPDAKGDSIYNGANDDASGTTAVITLAKYFGDLKSNQRTIVFAAFTAEEIGEYGSQYFSSQFDPSRVMAMFNIEMIGSESKWGGNSAFITGYERTDMGKILAKNLEGSTFTFYPDPYPAQGLFYRSDNASLARQGVPAHTISTTKIDVDKYYHTRGDEFSTIDVDNMTRIIKAIAISSRTIVEGTDTPTRVDVTQVR